MIPSASRALSLAAGLLWLCGGCGSLELPVDGVCFGDHIVPLLGRDCAQCHENGEYRILLRGRPEDYDSLLLYVTPYDHNRSPLLNWVAGEWQHPVVWQAGGAQLRTLAAWIDEGARRECGPPDGGEFDGDGGSDGQDGADDQGPVSFAVDIAPRLRTDCASCHNDGWWGIRLVGNASDYPEVMRYVDTSAPEETFSFLWWAAGGGKHPISWPVGGEDYSFFLRWVQQGAQNN